MDTSNSIKGAADALSDFPHKGGELTPQQVENLRALVDHVPKWFVWGPRRLNDRGEPKLPINPANGRDGKSNDEATAGTFDEAVAQVGARGYGRGGGVSVSMLGAAAGLVGIDLDHVRDPDTGELCGFATEVMHGFIDGYVEVSPSGHGLRIFAFAQGVKHCKVTTTLVGPDEKPVGVEVYPAGEARHLRCTGALVRGSGGVVLPAQAGVERLVQRAYALKAGGGGGAGASSGAAAGMSVDDAFEELTKYREEKDPAEVLAAMQATAARAPRGKLAQALRGTLTPWKGDHSSADYFLVCEAIRQGCGSVDDAVAVWRKTGLWREKSRRRDYQESTGGRAVREALQGIRQQAERREAEAAGAQPYTLPQGLPEALERSGDTLTRTKAGRVDSDKGNVVVLFRNDPRLAGLLAFNELSQRAERRGSWRLFDRRGAELPGPVTDDDVTRVEMWLRREFGMKMDRRDVLQGMEAAARDAKFDPLRDSLLRLRDQWDKVPRVDGWLTRYAKVDDAGGAEYVRAVGRCFLVGAVARAMQPGCQMDTVLAVEGSGGGGKSTMFQILAGAVGPGLFADGIQDASSTAALVEGTSGRWIVELAELAGVRRAADVEALKAALTRRADSYRRPYAMLEVEYPRRFVFVATTNRQQYLADSSGALLRRFWPVRTKATETDPIDRDALAEVAGQLWGEAVALYEAGATWHLDEATEPEAFRQWTQSRELRREDGAFQDECVEWLKKWLPQHDGKGAKLQDIARAVGDMKSAEGDQAARNRLADTLRTLGMESIKRGGTKAWHFTADGARRLQRLIDEDKRRERQEAEEAARQVNEC